MLNIKKFVSQKRIGYSANFSKSFIEGVAELSNGSIVKIYNYVETTPDNLEHMGEWTEDRPYIARIANTES